ncbi:MAG: carboxyl transferase domain-containing protein, partial [Microbacterium sp.]
PTLSVLLGEGTGGGALALLPADRTIAAAHAWLSPLPPEGASAIVYRDTVHAAELAGRQGVASAALRRAGIVDRIIAEEDDVTAGPEAFCSRMGGAITQELARLSLARSSQRLARRYERYRGVGA